MMKQFVGEKEKFAIEFEIIEFRQGLESKVKFWINNNEIGDFDNTGFLNSVIWSLRRIMENSKSLFVDNFAELSCKELFYFIVPFYNDPEKFFDLSYDEMTKLI